MTYPTFIWLIGILLLASPIIYLIGRLTRREDSSAPAARWLALAAVVGAWVPYILALQETSATLTIGAVALTMDGLSLLLAGLALGLGTLVVLYSIRYMDEDEGEEKYYAMLVAMIGVMIGLGTATDIFNLWVWFEAMAVTSYLLVAFYRNQGLSLEAGVKYLVQSATGSMLVLVGVALVLMQTGTLNIAEIRALAAPTPGFIVAGALFIIGFGVKVAVVPMHTWLPDAHSQAPTGISAMLSGVVIEAGLIALLRALGALVAISASWGVLLMAFGALNMLAGNLLALRQTQVKRMLAYSSLTHVGYMLLGLGIGISTGVAAGLEGSMFHLLNHGLMKGLAFLAAGTLLWVLHAAGTDHDALLVADLSGAGRRYPIVALTFSLAVLALGGLPPLAGFMSKWQIFVAGFQTGDALIMATVVFAGLMSVLSLGYYAPLVNTIYRKVPSSIVARGPEIPVLMQVPLALMAIAVLAIGLWPSLLTWLAAPAADALLAAFGG